MSRSKKEMDLTVGDPFRSLLKFAIPVILGNLFQLFYTLADTMIVGKTLGAQSLAAVGSTSIIIYFVFCFMFCFVCYIISGKMRVIEKWEAFSSMSASPFIFSIISRTLIRPIRVLS